MNNTSSHSHTNNIMSQPTSIAVGSFPVSLTTFPDSKLNKTRDSKSSTSMKRSSDRSLFEDYDYSNSSSDESVVDELTVAAYTTVNKNDYYPSEEHKFWQVHSSTTIIAPPIPMASSGCYSAMSYPVTANNYQRQQKQQQQSRIVLSLASQIQHTLRSTFDEVDAEIEEEWTKSRAKLNDALNEL